MTSIEIIEADGETPETAMYRTPSMKKYAAL